MVDQRALHKTRSYCEQRRVTERSLKGHVWVTLVALLTSMANNGLSCFVLRIFPFFQSITSCLCYV